MVPYMNDGDLITVARINELEQALGLPLSAGGDYISDAWQRIAPACGLPDSVIDSDGIIMFTATDWNRAVDYANNVAV